MFTTPYLYNRKCDWNEDYRSGKSAFNSIRKYLNVAILSLLPNAIEGRPKISARLISSWVFMFTILYLLNHTSDGNEGCRFWKSLSDTTKTYLNIAVWWLLTGAREATKETRHNCFTIYHPVRMAGSSWDDIVISISYWQGAYLTPYTLNSLNLMRLHFLCELGL